jgi:NADPH-dependent curcumin reductase CurA
MSQADMLTASTRDQGSAAVTTLNHQFRLAARPVGLPKTSDWNYTEEPVRAPNEGEVLVKIAYLSLDPAMRGWMNDVKSYIAPVTALRPRRST